LSCEFFENKYACFYLKSLFFQRSMRKLKRKRKNWIQIQNKNGGPSSQASHVCVNFPLWIIFYSNIDIKEEVYYQESGTQLEQVGTCVHLVRSHRQLWLTTSKPWVHLRGGSPSHWCCLDLQKSEKKDLNVCVVAIVQCHIFISLSERERERERERETASLGTRKKTVNSFSLKNLILTSCIYIIIYNIIYKLKYDLHDFKLSTG